MGLDMFLYKSTYVKNAGWRNEKFKIDVTVNNKPVPHIDNTKLIYVVEEIAYWRKFNALHKWFVNNCQGGVDNCASYFIPRETINKLVTLLEQIDSNNSLAEELLPVENGFFFGSTEYDKYYFKDVAATIKTLKSALKKIPPESTVDFTYMSSW